MPETQDQPAREQLSEQVAVIDDTLYALLLIIVALLLTCYTVRAQREQLLCASCPEQDCCPEQDRCCPRDLFPLQVTSSILTLAALLFFFQMAAANLCRPDADCAQQKAAQRNYIASGLVLLAALIRFAELLTTHSRAANEV